jgi:hypothetical protein
MALMFMRSPSESKCDAAKNVQWFYRPRQIFP